MKRESKLFNVNCSDVKGDGIADATTTASDAADDVGDGRDGGGIPDDNDCDKDIVNDDDKN